MRWTSKVLLADIHFEVRWTSKVLPADIHFEAFYEKTDHRTPRTGCSRLRRENSSEMTYLPLRWRSMSLMNTHRRDPRAAADVADEEDDNVEEEEDDQDEAVTGGAASPCVPRSRRRRGQGRDPVPRRAH